MDDNFKNANAGTKKKITVFRCLKDVESKNIEWLWKERFPKGKHSIVAGNPGTSWKVKDVVLDGINSI